MDTATPQSAAPGRVRVLPHLVLIALAGLAVYLNAIHGEFLWDDVHFIKNNAYLRNWSHVGDIFTGDVAAGSGERYGYYRPLAIFTYLLDHTLWGLDVRGYHLSNIALHIMAACCLYWVVYVLFHNTALSLLTALLYVVHPIHTESVAYISGRPDLLAAIFMLVTFALYAKQAGPVRLHLYAPMILSYGLALLSRESAVVLPFLLLLFHMVFRRRFRTLLFAPLAGMAVVYVALRLMLMPATAVSTTWFQRLPGFFAAIATYLRLLALPFGLHQEYGEVLFRFSDPLVIAGMAATAVCVLVFGLALSRKAHTVALGIGWFFLALAPVSGIYPPLKTYMAEHWLYVPAMGLFLIAGRVLQALRDRGHAARAGVAVLTAGLVAVYGGLTIRQNGYFSDPLTFYKRTLRYSPDSARIHNNLANEYAEAGDFEKAVSHFTRATQLDPVYPQAWGNLGHVHFTQGRDQEALTCLEKAISIDPEFAEAHNTLGALRMREGRIDQGLASFVTAAALKPRDPDILCNLALAHLRAGRRDEAIRFYGQAAEVDPACPRARRQLEHLGAAQNAGKP